MPTVDDLRTFSDPPAPEGVSPYLVPQSHAPIAVMPYDPGWPDVYRRIADGIREVLGARVLRIDHIGSTSVPGLAAKPIIDIDLTVADPDDEAGYVRPLVAAGWEHTVREPWWHGHRMLRRAEPRVNLHVFGTDSPETWRHLILRDHLRRDAGDRRRYAAIKQEAAALATASAETVSQYNARKEVVLREIVVTALRAAGVREP